MQSPNPARIPFLDGVRGYAAVWVMLGHFSTRAGLSIPILNSPGLAVDLFMVVSGFLMTQHFFVRQDIEPWEAPRTWLIFYIRRFWRIAPLYYTLLIPSFVAFGRLQDEQRWPLKKLLSVEYHPSGSVTLANVLAHVSFLFGLMPKYCTILTIPDWSLGLEMQFYAVFPFLMLLARRLTMLRFGVLAFSVWGLFRMLNVFALPSFLPLKLGLFLVGMLLAWAWMEDAGRLTARAVALLLFAVFVAACARVQPTGAPTGPIVAGVTVVMIGLLFYRETGWLLELERFLGNGVAHFLADVSYGVYLVHLLVMVPVLAKLCDMAWFVDETAPLRFVILTAIAGPITFGVAWVLFRVIETPGIRVGKSVIRRLYRR